MAERNISREAAFGYSIVFMFVCIAGCIVGWIYTDISGWIWFLGIVVAIIVPICFAPDETQTQSEINESAWNENENIRRDDEQSEFTFKEIREVSLESFPNLPHNDFGFFVRTMGSNYNDLIALQNEFRIPSNQKSVFINNELYEYFLWRYIGECGLSHYISDYNEIKFEFLSNLKANFSKIHQLLLKNSKESYNPNNISLRSRGFFR